MNLKGKKSASDTESVTDFLAFARHNRRKRRLGKIPLEIRIITQALL